MRPTIVNAEELHEIDDSVINQICMVDGSDPSAEDAQVSVCYGTDQPVSISDTPVVRYKGELMMALRHTICKQGPKVSYEYSEKTQRIRLVWQNHVVTCYKGEKTMYADGRKHTLRVSPAEAAYGPYQKYKDILVPMEQVCAALGFRCGWNEERTIFTLKKQPVSFRGKRNTTRYSLSLKKYAKEEYKRSPKVSVKTYRKLISASGDTTAGFKYMRIDRYRSVNKGKFRQYYQYLIRDYCRENGISPNKSSLYGKANVFLKAAKRYRLDPVYLVSQTFLESAFGTSQLASGNRIKRVAYRSFAKKKNGTFKTKKIRKKCKVYNLYGIKAYDADSFVGGTSYAYYKKWTTVNRAIYGAAKYISSNYIHCRYKQNTIFKMRFSPNKSMLWHQYATDPYYAEKIGLRMYLMSTCYADAAEFEYDYPAYK